jgi:hypothetical protein
MPRRDQYDITVSVDGIGNLGTFDTMTGGEVDSEAMTYRPGALGEAVSLGGTKTTGNVTVGRMMDFGFDLNIAKALIEAVGRRNVTITKIHLDVDRNHYDTTLVYTGKLKAVSFPDVDSESSEAGIMTLEVVIAGVPA